MPHRQLLLEILESARLKHAKGQPLSVVFDLDSTVFCVSHRTQEILKEIAQDAEVRRQFPQSAEQLSRIEANAKDWGIRPILSRHQVVGTLDFFETVRQKWAERFFSSSYLHLDQPYPGVIEYIQALDQAGAEIRYLTGRDIPRMQEGTLKSLAQWQLPLQNQSLLHMKPNSERHDAEFKRDTLREIFGPHQSTWFFENEPVIINLVRRDLPHIRIVFIDSVHAGRETAPPDLPIIPMSYEIKNKG